MFIYGSAGGYKKAERPGVRKKWQRYPRTATQSQWPEQGS